MRVEKASEIGFCFGVKRAIDILERASRERNGVETLGDGVHNRQVLRHLTDMGVRVAQDIDDVKGDTVVISAHGSSPQLKEEIKKRNLNMIDTTCPIVLRAQRKANDLAQSGFLVIIYGDVDHPEVKGILGWANGRGVVALDDGFITGIDATHSRIGILSQTTQIPAYFARFTLKLAGSALLAHSELRVFDTICHYIKKRQAATLELAKKVDLMLVVGGSNSANTNRLVELCSGVTETYLVEAADEINPSWLQGNRSVGVVGGASTAEQTIDDVVVKLETLN